MEESTRKIQAHVKEAEQLLEQIYSAVADVDILETVRRKQNMLAVSTYVGQLMGQFQEIGAEAAQLAFDCGVTKKQLSADWQVPASTFTGMTKRAW